jgi:AcrR family transcriptional regulator
MSPSVTSLDPRALRSRHRIIEALREELRAGRAPTISALAERADVTRATFYRNFDTIEGAAWSALLGDFEALLARDADERHHGVSPDFVGTESLRAMIDLLRLDGELSRLANAYRDDSGLPGLAVVILTQVRRFRAEFGDPDDAHAATEDVYVATGLYGVLSGAIESDAPAGSIAVAAYAMLPEWMRHPRSDPA